MLTPTLTTRRILLRPLSMADAQACFNGWTGDRDVTKFMNYSRHVTIDDTNDWLALEQQNLASDTNFTWGLVLKATGELFGSAGVQLNEEYGLWELGYNIMKKYWNLGLTTEAAERIVRFANEELGVCRLLGRHAKDNPASGRVMEHLGFVYQRDSSYTCFDGVRSFESREYLLELPESVCES